MRDVRVHNSLSWEEVDWVIGKCKVGEVPVLDMVFV